MISSTMNRNFFALLLILPVAVFAADRLTASNLADGGGKEKKAAKTAITATTAPDQAEPTQEQAVQTESKTEEGSAIAPSDGDASVLTAAAKTTIIKLSMDALDASYEEQQDNEQLTYFHSDVVEQELYRWLTNHVMNPLQKANPMTLDVNRAFSRCSSGYRLSLVTSEGKVTNEGWLLGDEGCWQRPLGKFAYDLAAGKVNVHLGTTEAMVPLDEYLKLLKDSFKEG